MTRTPMRARLFHPSMPALQGLVESFLFQDSDGTTGSYTTFPNTNLCLAIYRTTEAKWDRRLNRCQLLRSPEPWSSRLYGFHQLPFHVDWSGTVRQVNILFKPGAIARFTDLPVRLIDMVDDPLTELFGDAAEELVDRLFSIEHAHDQVRELEAFLVARLRPLTLRAASTQHVLRRLVYATPGKSDLLHTIASDLRTAPSTIYRSMMDVVGQSPKAFFRTVRFRRALADILSVGGPGTWIAFDNGYFDQAHLIKDMRQFTGGPPALLQRRAQVVQGEFVWVCQ